MADVEDKPVRRRPLPSIVSLVRLLRLLDALRWSFLLLGTVPAYFAASITLQKGLSLLAGQALFFLVLIAPNLWLARALGRRQTAAWYVHIAFCVLNALWLLVAHLWYHRPLFRLSSLGDYVMISTLLFWFFGEVKAWFNVGNRAADVTT